MRGASQAQVRGTRPQAGAKSPRGRRDRRAAVRPQAQKRAGTRCRPVARDAAQAPRDAAAPPRACPGAPLTAVYRRKNPRRAPLPAVQGRAAAAKGAARAAKGAARKAGKAKEEEATAAAGAAAKGAGKVGAGALGQLTMLGHTPFEVGAIATAALLGSALLTLAIGSSEVGTIAGDC